MARRRILLAASCAALLVGLIVAAALLAASTLRAQSSDDLNDLVSDATESHRLSLIVYELTHLPNRWLANVAGWFDDEELDEAALLRRWFEQQRAGDRKRAERLLERRLSRAVRDLRLDTALPLFGRVRVVWPPVDVDLSERLHVLAVSARDEVKLVRTELLTSDIERGDYEQIESAVEADGRWSAWVGGIGGVALYPAPVAASRDYQRTLQVMAHEWTHHYLGFYPLGLSYARSSAMRTINETVADIAGDQLAQSASALPGDVAPPTSAAEPEWEAIREKTDPILRQLRLDVDALLDDGELARAERLMAEVRLELIELGRPFRRINQAWLAFRGGYGASPSSASPWGARLIEFRDRQASLADFMADVREIGSAEEADRLLPR